MPEVAWFSSAPDAILSWSEGSDLGWLHFVDPNGERAAILVTKGPTRQVRPSDGAPGSNVWHIDIAGTTATVSPSVHFIGRWHSPNPVQFRLVESLD